MTETTDAPQTVRSETRGLGNSFTESALPIVNFGIAGFGYAFGADQDVSSSAGSFVTDPERVIRWGYQTFHRAEPAVSATMLAANAARDVLKQLDMAATELDLVVLATSEMPDYLHWD